jgi:hypothetical protein
VTVRCRGAFDNTGSAAENAPPRWVADAGGRTGGIPMLYELRFYDCLPGRLPDLVKRFETVTMKIWERHGIRQVGFWTTVIGGSNQALTYMIAWESLADREKKWAAFQADPEWQKKRAESEANGPIVANIRNEILTPTAFSAVK